MGHVYAYGHCYGCGGMFGFHPDLVPSIRVDAAGQPAADGVKQPVCSACIARANADPQRAALGLPPLVPLPGAYEPGPDAGP